MTEDQSKAWRELIREATMAFIVVTSLALVFYFAWAVLNVQIPARNENLAFAVWGLIGGTMVGGIFGAYFGIQLSQSRQSKAADSTTVQTPPGSTTTIETPSDLPPQP